MLQVHKWKFERTFSEMKTMLKHAMPILKHAMSMILTVRNIKKE